MNLLEVIVDVFLQIRCAGRDGVQVMASLKRSERRSYDVTEVYDWDELERGRY